MDLYQTSLPAVFAAILVLYTFAESPLEHLLERLLESLFESPLVSLLESLHESVFESLLERLLESLASGGVEFSTASFWPMDNPEFVEALAN
jgi:hypothetical protein